MNANKKIDLTLILIVLTLVTFGAIMVYSAGDLLSYKLYDGNSFQYLRTQLISLAIGFAMMFFLSFIPFDLYAKFCGYLLIASIILLILVFTPIGHYVVSAEGRKFRRWMRLGFFNFQPVEIVKLAMIIYTASFLTRKKAEIGSFFRGTLPTLIILGIVFFLLYFQPDFGSAILLATTVIAIMIVGGSSLIHIIFIVSPAVLALSIWIRSDTYKMKRITDFVASLSDPLQTNYQVAQSMNALADGGFLGKGVGNGIYKNTFLPYPHTDFIFAVVGEELGFLGGVFLIGLFMALIWRGFYIAKNAEDRFGSLIAFGITLQIGLQAIINIASTIGAFPTKGITLPFISYGGSSMMMSLISVGILMGISRSLKKQ